MNNNFSGNCNVTFFRKYFFNKKTCVRPNTECKLCGGLLDLDNWIHRLFRESQGRWGSVPARGCKGGFQGGLGGGGLMWEGGGGLGWDYWIRRRGGWRFGSKKGVAPISSYSTLRFPGKQTWRLVARMIVIIFKILKRTILHNMCHHCHWWRHLLRIIILRRDAGVSQYPQVHHLQLLLVTNQQQQASQVHHPQQHFLRIIILKRDGGVLLLSNKVNNNNNKWWCHLLRIT